MMTRIEQINCYFAHLNPVAEKIAFDIREVKSAYDHVWLTLSSIEQDDIVNDTIMKPEITIKYYKNCNTSKDVHNRLSNSVDTKTKNKATNCEKYNIIYAFDRQRLSTFIHQKIGLKIIHDDNIGDYRDEHSFPFSYKTKSQINLSVILSNTHKVNNIDIPVKEKPFLLQPDNRSGNKTDNTLLIKSNDERVEKRCNKVENQLTELTRFGQDQDQDQSNLLYNNSGSKNTLLGNLTDSTDSENDTKDQNAENCKLLPEKVQIPKGFDFLSNW